MTQRGNNREPVFRTSEDRYTYLDLLRKHGRVYGVRILGYCLMTNHVHLVAIPEGECSLAQALAHAHSAYAAGWNRREGRSGHVWQGRFFSCPLDRAHLVTALRYVDQNPVRAGMVEQAWEWEWSSARVHSWAGAGDGILDRGWVDYCGGWDYEEWRTMLAGEDGGGIEELRRATLAGEPLGSGEFVKTLERKAGRRLRVFPRGRPPRVALQEGCGVQGSLIGEG